MFLYINRNFKGQIVEIMICSESAGKRLKKQNMTLRRAYNMWFAEISHTFTLLTYVLITIK